MNKMSFLYGLALGITISVFFSVAQEFIMIKKEKKVSVSCQQCVESLGEYEHIFSGIIKELSRVFMLTADINGHVLGHIDKYIDGDSGGVQRLNKVQRTEFYKKMTEICTESSQMRVMLGQMAKDLEKQLSVIESL